MYREAKIGIEQITEIRAICTEKKRLRIKQLTGNRAISTEQKTNIRMNDRVIGASGEQATKQ